MPLVLLSREAHYTVKYESLMHKDLVTKQVRIKHLQILFFTVVVYIKINT